MSIIKQISVFDGSSWGIDDIGANAGNIDLIAPSSTVTTNLAGSSNLFTALNNILPTNQLTASKALVTDANKKLAASTTTATQLSYVHGVTSNIQTQIDTLNTNLTNMGEFVEISGSINSTSYSFDVPSQYCCGIFVCNINGAGNAVGCFVCNAGNVTLNFWGGTTQLLTASYANNKITFTKSAGNTIRDIAIMIG